ncbi:MAG: class I SAM-dependent methyltransferase [Thermoleophilaceae bacterium]|nr:class I SAM-dependent methyltransferase [Thermoleophilaceae bacterium]
MAEVIEKYVQQNQPDGVPPLELTGERTLPDLPEENYWYRRHLVVYDWIARRVGGKSVVDMACGEGYGTAVLAQSATHVTGVDANPEAFEHAQARYGSDRIEIVRDLIETYRPAEKVDTVSFLQTIEHVQDPAAVLRHFASLLTPGGKVYVSTPNLLTLAPEGAEKSGNPWHVKEYKPGEFRELCQEVFTDVTIYGVFHARKLRVHELLIRHGGWDRIHKGLRISKLFYDRFTPAISEHDFVLRRGESDGSLVKALDFVAVCSGPRA